MLYGQKSLMIKRAILYVIFLARCYNRNFSKREIRFFNFGCFFYCFGTRLSCTKQLGVMATHVTCEICRPILTSYFHPAFQTYCNIVNNLLRYFMLFYIKNDHTSAPPMKTFIRSNSSSHFVAILFHFCYFW